MKILIRTPNWLGDNILALPAIQMLRAAYPAAHIATLTRAPMHEIWSMAEVDAVHALRQRKGIAGIKDRFQIAQYIAREKYDVALICPNSFDSACVMWLARIPTRIGWPTDGRRLLLTHPVSLPKEYKQMSHWQRYVSLARAWCDGCQHIPVTDMVCLTVPSSAREKMSATRGESAPPYICLNPGATYGTAKQWLPDRFAHVALHAHDAYGMDVVIIGGPGDVSRCSVVMDYIEKKDAHAGARWCHNIAGKTDIPTVAAWLEGGLCTITNDTGGMHLSAAVGTPVIALFGATDWRFTAPIGRGHRIISHTPSCGPCLARECARNHACMDSITVDEVCDALHAYCQ